MFTRQYFIDIGFLFDNEYADLYVDLINCNLTTRAMKYKTQRHHIIPKYYFKYNKLEIDNSSSNIVNLLYKDHLLAHYYLAMNAPESTYFKFSNANVLYCAYNKTLPLEDFDSISSLPDMQLLYEEARKGFSGSPNRLVNLRRALVGKPCSAETRRKISIALTGKRKPCRSTEAKRKTSATLMGHEVKDDTRKKISAGMKNRVNMYKDTIQVMVHPDEVDSYSTQGYMVGRVKKIPITDGHKTICIFEQELDKYMALGFRRGHCHKTVPPGYVWINNGVSNTRIPGDKLEEYIQAGYHRGRIKKGGR